MTSTFQPKKVPVVFDALQDDKSRAIYKHRLLYSLTGDENEVAAMVNENFIEPLPTGKLCCYGAGNSAKWFVRFHPEVSLFIDDYRQGEFLGRPVLSFEEFLRRHDCREFHVVLAMSSDRSCRRIRLDLAEHGLQCVSTCNSMQYFDLPALDLKPNECFADIGALDGETTEVFFEYCPQGRACVFEPNPTSADETRKNLRGYSGAKVFFCALSDTNGTARFSSTASPHGNGKISGAIADNGDVEVQTRALDEIVYGGGYTPPLSSRWTSKAQN